MVGLNTSTRLRAIMARRRRRISSSLLPENIGPQITSIQPTLPVTMSIGIAQDDTVQGGLPSCGPVWKCRPLPGPLIRHRARRSRRYVVAGREPLSETSYSIFGWTPIKPPGAFEDAVLRNWSCRDSRDPGIREQRLGTAGSEPG